MARNPFVQKTPHSSRPSSKKSFIGIAPTLEGAEVLEDGKRWKRINYRGVVGWVDADGR